MDDLDIADNEVVAVEQLDGGDVAEFAGTAGSGAYSNYIAVLEAGNYAAVVADADAVIVDGEPDKIVRKVVPIQWTTASVVD